MDEDWPEVLEDAALAGAGAELPEEELEEESDEELVESPDFAGFESLESLESLESFESELEEPGESLEEPRLSVR